MPTESDLNAIRKVHHPVHSFTQRLFYLPRRRPFSTPPWKIVFGKVWCQMMWPNHLSFYHLTIASGECGRPTTLVITLRTKSFCSAACRCSRNCHPSASFFVIQTLRDHFNAAGSNAEPRTPEARGKAPSSMTRSLFSYWKKGVKIVKTYSS